MAIAATALGVACGDDARLELVDPTDLGGNGGTSGAPEAGAAGAADAGSIAPTPDAGADAGSDPDVEDDGDYVSSADEERELDVLATEAHRLLSLHCGSCHAGTESVGGVGAIDDIDALIASGLIVPGNAAGSPLIEAVRAGRMPPADVTARPSVGEQWLLETFIDNLPAFAEECEAPAHPSVDETYAAMLADVLAQPEADRAFIRYASLTDTPGGTCDVALEERRHALFQAVNGVSLDPEIHQPVPIDAGELVYRLDIRDYDWDRPIDLDDDGSEDHGDGWLALVAAAGPYAVELQGPEADALREATDAAVPVLPSGALVWTASSGDAYYALVGARANINDTEVALGIGIDQNHEDGVVRRAGFERYVERSDIVAGRSDIIVERHPFAGSSGYWSLMPQYNCGSSSMYDDPSSYDTTAWQTIWHLPNGLFAYSVADLEGTRATAPLNACEMCCSYAETLYPAGGNPAGCHACHHGGLAPVRDEVLAVVQRFPEGYDADSLDAFTRIYSAPDLEARMAADNARYLDALTRAGVPASIRSPLSYVFLSFERAPLGIRRTAAELGTTPAALRQNIARLPAGFAPLAERGASITRAAMTEGLGLARCVLSEQARNRPSGCASDP